MFLCLFTVLKIPLLTVLHSSYFCVAYETPKEPTEPIATTSRISEGNKSSMFIIILSYAFFT
jgi:hypothetical protein